MGGCHCTFHPPSAHYSSYGRYGSSAAQSMQHLKCRQISRNLTQFLLIPLSRNHLFCRHASMRWRRRKAQPHMSSMSSFWIMPMDTNHHHLLCLLLNLMFLQLLWYCQLTLRAQRWISRSFAWYTICHPPSRPIFVKVLSLECMPSQRSTAPIWRKWVSSLVRSLTWNGQSVIGYHAWTKLSSNAIIIAILLSFRLYVLFLHVLLCFLEITSM